MNTPQVKKILSKNSCALTEQVTRSIEAEVAKTSKNGKLDVLGGTAVILIVSAASVELHGIPIQTHMATDLRHVADS